MIKLKTLRCGDSLDDLGGPEVITMVLTKKGQESHNQRSSERERERLEDGDTRSQGMQAASRQAGKETHSPLAPPEGRQPC